MVAALLLSQADTVLAPSITSPAMLESTTADANSYAAPVAVEERSAARILDGQSFHLAKRRASKACQRCRAHKMRCDFTERSDACKNCIGVVECVFIESKRRK